jgi:hypothetical protein
MIEYFSIYLNSEEHHQEKHRFIIYIKKTSIPNSKTKIEEEKPIKQK